MPVSSTQVTHVHFAFIPYAKKFAATQKGLKL